MEELSLIKRLAAADLSPETVRVGVRLLALMDERGHGVLSWEEYLSLLGIANTQAARRYLTRLQQAGVFHYTTNGRVEWWIDAPLQARFAPLEAREDDAPTSPRAATGAKRAATGARDDDEENDAPLEARNAPLEARNAPLEARDDHDLIDDLIYRFNRVTKRQPSPVEREALAEFATVGQTLLAEIEKRWAGIKSKSSLSGYMRNVGRTLMESGVRDYETPEDRRRRYIPDQYADIIIG